MSPHLGGNVLNSLHFISTAGLPVSSEVHDFTPCRMPYAQQTNGVIMMVDVFFPQTRGTVHSANQGCQVGPFGARFQKFGPKQHLLAPKFLFGPFWLVFGPFAG